MLDERQMNPNPVEEFRSWFRMATDQRPGDWYDPTAMTLATSGKDGTVTARLVLLKDFGEEGFVFYTNYDSRKGRQLSENPRAALVFHWPYLQRQVRVEGTVTRVSRAESEQYFWSRPRASQLAAAISAQSGVIADRKFLDDRFEALQQSLGNQPVPLPEHWGGYRLRAEKIEFWEHRDNRLHDRICYSRSPAGGWVLERLAP